MNLKKQTYKACRELLIAKVYPHLQVEPYNVANKIQNDEFYKTIYGNKNAEQLQNEFNLQDKYLKQSNDNDLKYELTVMNLAFVTELEKNESDMERKALLIESGEILDNVYLEAMQGVSLICKGKTKEDAIKSFRKHLSDLPKKYTPQINKAFKKLKL